MKSVIIFLIIINAVHSSAQSSWGLKIYQNTDIFNVRYIESTEIQNVKFSRITFAFAVENSRGYTHEVELFIPEISRSVSKVQFPLEYEFRKNDNTFDNKITSYSIRYELSKRLTEKVKPLTFLMGVGINPYYLNIENHPKVETAYYASNKLYGFALNLIPRVKYRLSSRLSVDLNMPLKVYDFRGNLYWVKNPSIPVRQQKSDNYENIFFESAYTIRLGLTYALRSK